jgi:hypothetical protein
VKIRVVFVLSIAVTSLLATGLGLAGPSIGLDDVAEYEQAQRDTTGIVAPAASARAERCCASPAKPGVAAEQSKSGLDGPGGRWADFRVAEAGQAGPTRSRQPA